MVQEINESAKFEYFTNNLTLCGKANKNKEYHDMKKYISIIVEHKGCEI